MENDDIPLLINKIPEIQYLAPVLFGGGGTNNVTRNDKAGSYGVKGIILHTIRLMKVK